MTRVRLGHLFPGLLQWLGHQDTLPKSNTSRPSKSELAREVSKALRQLTTGIGGLDERGARHLRVNPTDLRCLDVLSSRGPLRPSELAALVGLSSGGLSIALERLEGAGYVRRRMHDKDRRGIVVEATEHAKAADETLGALTKAMRHLISGFSSGELEIIRRFLDETRTAIESSSGG